jgi:Putative zinc-finger
VADLNQFGSGTPHQGPDAQHCAQCEAMLADVIDGTLSAADQATFDLHAAGCPDCTTLLAEARRGASLLGMLRPFPPEPSAMLLDRIFADTIGQTATAAAPAATQAATQPNTLLGIPAWTTAASTAAASTKVLPFRQRVVNAFRIESLRHTLMQPRLAMTAAMAFFSIALTLNLTGVKISQIRASDFTPSSIKRTFYETNARVARTFDNMRVVYELESRVRELQSASDNESPATAPAPKNDSAPSNQPSGQPDQKQQENPDHKQASPRPKSGSSRSESPDGRLQYVGSLSANGLPPAVTSEFVVFDPRTNQNQQQGGLV